jgi:flavin-dependent dehydrogenase
MIAAQMPVRATTRGEARTRLERDCDVLVCGASFAGLAIARELAGSGARVLMIDRYEIGERQTSACAMPTRWLNAMELQASHRQTFDEIVVHSPFHTSRWSLPWSFSTFDYRELCALLWDQADDGGLEFQTATVTGREGNTVQTDRGPLTAPLIVDGLGWRRMLSNGAKIQPPNAPMSRGLEVHPHGSGEEMELWINPRYIRSGYSWNFPAEDELRVGVGSFRPADHVKQPTVKLAGDLGLPAEGYQGNWIPHKLRAAVEDGVFFVGDSAGHCLPLTAEGIRTALYFGLACGRELRAVVEGRITRERALKRYGDFSAAHAKKFAWMLRAQQAAGFTTPSRSLATVIRCFENRRLCGWVFDRYLDIAPPAFVADGARALTRSRLAAVSA